MPRRVAQNRTGISRLSGVDPHQVWVGMICVRCGKLTTFPIRRQLLVPEEAYRSQEWRCSACRFRHSRLAGLPFRPWPRGKRAAGSPQASSFWQGFFRIATEHPESYWKQCNVCGKVLPFSAFSKHVGWGPLERQMECRSCKGAINATLNPRRTKQQLYESATRRRIANLLLMGEERALDLRSLFRRFGGRCFKTHQKLSIQNRSQWQVDHILPATYLYPLTEANACLLSTDANQAKRGRWPSEFFTNNELIKLARITGANLDLISRRTPLVNPDIDVNACVSRFLRVRETSNLKKRITELKDFLVSRGLVTRLRRSNKKLLGFL